MTKWAVLLSNCMHCVSSLFSVQYIQINIAYSPTHIINSPIKETLPFDKGSGMTAYLKASQTTPGD